MDKLIDIIISALPEAVGAILAASIITLLTILRKKNTKIKNLRELGVNNVYSDRKHFETIRSKLFSKSKKIKLHSIYANLGFQNLDTLIEEALKDGKSIEILLSDPSSEYVMGNDKLQLALMSSNTQYFIKKDIDLLKIMITKSTKHSWKGNLKVKLYQNQPMWSIYIFDDEVYASPYLFRTEGSDTPCIHAVNKNSNRTPYGQFLRHYQKIWENAKEVDFSNY